MTRCALEIMQRTVDHIGYCEPEDFALVAEALRQAWDTITRLQNTQGCVEVMREDQGMIDPEDTDLRF